MTENTDDRRLIEAAFPLKQASLDSVHEKNVRHGHISTLHIWPARRPLAASRAALIAALLPDPGDADKRRELCEKIGGKVVQTIDKGRIKEETKGGILHWKRETENAEDLEWFRQEIRKAYGGRAPRVLDPFAGGGAIPLEAMRLGCEVTAQDLNPVAWFILKCTLEYPQKLAGQKLPLPEFALQDENFMIDYLKAQGFKGKALNAELKKFGFGFAVRQKEIEMAGTVEIQADLAWHVRAWGLWVLKQARRQLAEYYPAHADFEAIKPGMTSYEKQPMKRVPNRADGTPDINSLNAGFSDAYIANPANPRWLLKPTVACLWARSVQCKNCRAELPLLKTRWLCKKNNKRVLLTMEPRTDKSGVVFGIENNPPVNGGNAAQRTARDKQLGAGTMSRSGATCPCCEAIMTMKDIRLEGQAGRLGAVMTVVVVNGQKGKEYRLPMEEEIVAAKAAKQAIDDIFAEIPFGIPDEPVPQGASRVGGGSPFTTYIYGLTKWRNLFIPRQLLALGVFVKWTRKLRKEISHYPPNWIHAITAYLALTLDRTAERNSTICHYDISRDSISGTFQRYALPITWDFAESITVNSAAGGYFGQIGWVARYIEHGLATSRDVVAPFVFNESAISGLDFNMETQSENLSELRVSIHSVLKKQPSDLIITDPPYYDAIPYSDLMDFFYIWLRRTLYGLSPEIDQAFQNPLAPKWDAENNDGELIDDASRFSGNKKESKKNYEDGMARVFKNCHQALTAQGRLVVVFAH
ncbi:MAG: DUF1156 domain-containing protein, partial [Gammaproteobacteria bacterium]|nr:DUF1156 domain-containing protein [Gammaproteobacteria bacterium]